MPPASSPTPEEISARLEALLKRTHALRAQQPPASSGGPLTITWPPPDRELERYDVVDVPDESPVTAAAEQEAASATPAVAEPVAPPPAAPDEPRTAEVAKPDWSELRLRSASDESAGGSAWGWVLTTALVLATLGQAGYIWYLHSGAAVESARIRVDGPEGADVRVDGQSIGSAPLERDLDAGDHAVEVVDKGRVLRADRVSTASGRTVVLVALAPAETATPDDGTTPGPTAQAAPGAVPAATPAPVNPELVSDTTGAVTIESTPPGLPVTMGGRARGVTPLTLGKIPPGRHDVLVGATTKQVDVTAGEVATLRVPR